MSSKLTFVLFVLLALAGCSAPEPEPEPVAVPEPEPPPRIEYALAIHGGAGVIDPSMPESTRTAYEESLERALHLGRSILDRGGPSLDAVERVIRLLEDDPLFNAGKGAVFNHLGENELDASIMNGANLACGAVAGVRTVKNPISAARGVMEQTRHVLLGGPGADEFAREIGLEAVAPEYFYTVRRWEQLQKLRDRPPGDERGTVGVVALDREGNLAAGTSTGGLTGKRYGRIGDSPIVGAGTYADNRTCAVSGTGTGEEFIRHGVARSVAAMMELGGLTLAEAARRVVHETLSPGDGGIVAVGADGSIAMEFNSRGMYRGAADSQGRFEVKIWD
ncbi:MAG: isoaspartyl peptidase/L-asparaginase [bacterium]|nr:isoaspartyl peptidase/L-asparaginase [bacterium]